MQAAILLRAAHSDKIITGGLDVCQKLSGVTLKLLAYERLLTECPVWRGKVRYRQARYMRVTYGQHASNLDPHALSMR